MGQNAGSNEVGPRTTVGTPATVDAYVASFEPDVAQILGEVARRFRRAAPDAVEAIRYGMPQFMLPNGHPLYFAGWKRHVSLHDVPSLDDPVEQAIAGLRSGSDTVRFQLAQPVPYDVIEAVVVAVASRPPRK